MAAPDLLWSGMGDGDGRCRILVVDDDPDVIEAAMLILSYEGHDCRSAGTGRDALAELDLFKPDIVILDIGLPDISGCELAKMIRARGEQLHLVAFTGSDSDAEVAQMTAAGFDQQVTKPTGARSLRAIVQKALSSGR